jgi:hypothetical protein
MADGHTLVVGTMLQGLYTVDQDTHAVTWHPAPHYPSTADTALMYHTPVAMANGKVLLVGEEFGVEFPYAVLDGGQHLVEWDSHADTFSQLIPADNNPYNTFRTIGLARSADHKWASFGSLYLYSSDSDSFVQLSSSALKYVSIWNSALNADGSEIAVLGLDPSIDGDKVFFLDRSGNLLGTTVIAGGGSAPISFSPDGTKLYVPWGPMEIVDAANFKDLGLVNAGVVPSPDWRALAVDGRGRFYAGSLGGILASDTTAPFTSEPPLFQCDEPYPNAFPLNTSGIAGFATGTVPPGVDIYFGGQPATLTSAGDINIPASSVAGPVDLDCVDSLGELIVRPYDLSYGVDPIAVSGTLLPPTGNPIIRLYGFGILNADRSTSPTVTVGGAAAVSVTPIPAGKTNLQGVWVQVPNGTPGQTADITVAGTYGSGTLPKAVTYIPSANITGVGGAQQVTFDTHRNVLYELTMGGVSVIEPDTLSVRPLLLPSFTSAFSLYAMALSPDGTRMILIGSGGNIVVLDPDQPEKATLLTGLQSFCCTVAITNSNLAVSTGLTSIDLNSASTSSLHISAPNAWPTMLRNSADGKHLYGATTGSTGGNLFAFDPSTLTGQQVNLVDGFWMDLAVSPDGSQFAAISPAGGDTPPGIPNPVFLFDSTLHLAGGTQYPALSYPDDGLNWGALYSPQGKVIVLSAGDSIEFWDVKKGILIARLMAPESLVGSVTPAYAPNGWAVPQMALDAEGNTIFAVSKSGITVMKLATPIDQMAPSNWPLPELGVSGRGTSAGMSVPKPMR